MKLIVTSSEDPASMNIREQLLDLRDWRENGRFAEHEVLTAEDFLIVQVDRIHLSEDHIDERVHSELGKDISTTIFASRHRSESKIPTLTVHPVGNFSKAEFGGVDGILSPASPQLMTQALRTLARKAEQLDFKVSFETTHHGPLTDGPAFYVEIGSHEELWTRRDAASAIAETILEAECTDHPAVICVGGGHYAPRFTDVALSRKVAIGHMAANYALDSLDERNILQMAENSENAKMVYFHRKSMPRSSYRNLVERFSTLGIEEVSSNDFEEL
ncbi:MAG: transposase [Methanobacteriota archaeon]|nr:MAG: transposase [Euryarchaeota archaeon]